MSWDVFYSDSPCLSLPQLNRQNRSLKRKSMMLLSHLGPDAVTDIDLDGEDEEGDGEGLDAAGGVCASPQCRTTISGTRQISICASCT